MATIELGATRLPRSKISVPGGRPYLGRRRLWEVLDRAVRDGSVTLIVAPGGAGKTSLVASWAPHANCPVAWYNLDRADGDPRRLVDGLAAAVELALPGSATACRSALAAGVQEIGALGLLLGAIEDQPLALVLDDFQHLDQLPIIEEVWEHLFRFRPTCLAPLILSRTIPALGFSALAEADALRGLGHAELSFTVGEARDLLTAHGLAADGAGGYVARTGGWATGLLLLARTASPGSHLLRGRTGALLEHLGDELLAALTPALRTFIMESALLGPVTAAEADAILDRRDSALYFAEAVAHSLFITQDGSTYRYHDLFAEYLTGLLASQHPERLRDLRRRAAAYWTGAGDLPRALEQVAAAEDWTLLADLLYRERRVLWERGLMGTVLSNMERLPAAYRTAQLQSLVGYARLRRGEHAAALEAATDGMQRAERPEDWLPLALLRVQTMAFGGRPEEGLREAEEAMRVAQQLGETATITALQEVRGYAWLAVGDLQRGEAEMLAALAAHRRTGEENAQARTLYNLATSLIAAGLAREATDYLAQAAGIWSRLDNTAMLANVAETRAQLHGLLGDLSAGTGDALQAMELAQQAAHPSLLCSAEATLAELRYDSGELPAAGADALAATTLAARLNRPDTWQRAQRVSIAVALARRERARGRSLLDEAIPLTTTPTDRALLQVAEGHLALRSGAARRAAEILGSAARDLEALHRRPGSARALLLQAEALLTLDASGTATEALNHLAELILPLGCEGYLRATLRQTPRVQKSYRLLRGLHRPAQLLLERLVDGVLEHGQGRGTRRECAAPLQAVLWISPFDHGSARLNDLSLDLASGLPPKARELLFYAARQQRPLDRTELLDALWDDLRHAADGLWNASRHLRRFLGSGRWQTTGRVYQLALTVENTEHTFDQLAARTLSAGLPTDTLDAAEQALALIGAGGYLDWCASPWAEDGRTRTRERAVAVALRAAECYAARNQCTEAIAVCRRACALDPLDEAVHLALLRALVNSGQVGEARSAYHAFRRMLQLELDAEPGAELVRFARATGW